MVLFFLLFYFLDQTILLFTLFFPFFVIKIYQIVPKDANNRKVQLNQFILVTMITILIICFAYWGYADGNRAKTTNHSKIVEFKEGDS
jgi:hypothetical protein